MKWPMGGCSLQQFARVPEDLLENFNVFWHIRDKNCLALIG
jgi:hypothetical protein